MVFYDVLSPVIRQAPKRPKETNLELVWIRRSSIELETGALKSLERYGAAMNAESDP
jgi:hypothetical protein